MVDADQLAHAVGGDGDRAAGDRAVDGLLGEGGLRLLELLLHLLRLLEEGVHVEAAAEGVERVLGHRVSTVRSWDGAGGRAHQSLPDLLDQPRAERLAEEGLGVERRRLGVAVVVAVDVVVGRADRLGRLDRSAGAGRLERLARRGGGDGRLAGRRLDGLAVGCLDGRRGGRP